MRHFSLRPVLATALLCASWLGSSQPARAADDIVFSFRAGTTEDNHSAVTRFGGALLDGTPTPTKAFSALDEETEYQRIIFDGVNDFARAASAVAVDTDDGLTLDVWFRADRLSGHQTLFSNTESAGFTLRLEDDQLRGLVRVGDRYLSVEGRTRLVTGRWYHAAFRVELTGPGTENPAVFGPHKVAFLSLHLDGASEGNSFAALSESELIVNSPLSPLLGAEPTSSALPTWFFGGRIHAAIVRNYAADLRWLSVATPHDREMLSGIPAYFDGVSTASGAGNPIDTRVSWPADEHAAAIQTEMFIPFTNAGYVIQGVAHSREWQLSTQNTLYLSQYWKDRDGKIASSTFHPENRSLITEIDADTKRVTRCFMLEGKQAYGHVDGLAARAGNLYVASNGYVSRYVVGNGASTPLSTTASCGRLAPVDEFNTIHSSYVSFGYIGTRPVMLVGTAGDIGQAHSYELLPDHSIRTTPSARYWTPQNTQGMAVYKDSTGEYLVAMRSRGGKNNSVLYRYKPSDALCTGTTNDTIGEGCRIPAGLEYFDGIPAGGEDLANVAGTLWSASEAGAIHYKLRDDNAWPQLFPFVFTLSMEDIPFRSWWMDTLKEQLDWSVPDLL